MKIHVVTVKLFESVYSHEIITHTESRDPAKVRNQVISYEILGQEQQFVTHRKLWFA